MNTQQSGTRTKVHAARFSIFSNTALIILKLIVGGMTGSVSVISEAIHSMVDLVASFMAFFAVRASDIPADHDHPYGHGKYENVSGALEGLLILGAGTFLAHEAIQRLSRQEPPEKLGWALGVMVLSAGVNTWVSGWLMRVARETHSDALHADAEHLRTDVYTSLGVLAGLSLVYFTGNPIFDPLAALVVTGILFMIGWRTMMNSMQQLMDVSLPPGEIERIAQLAQEHPAIHSFHQIRTRRVGGQRHIDLHIRVSGDLTVREGHDIAHDLRDRIEGEMEGAHVVIHVEPSNEGDVHIF
ncbi:MAG: cation diffusion facilitator family transporter [Armatimonadetes bacterium]|nr:cation diffusion facilitator family transporter [Armatimonadota bacterium]